ncbi:kinetochore protein Nuf2 [Scyliorhinus canicula]|uniref:kinetochore protein Nuf2 n=1 Tax=Scyliorhinus canicula TaxID=7830 RepID=UPI0018F66726|nr:kinetochore protein Nuf2 [Scyliorhinus canicula]XP_038650832.1 kinetochore protein Nuf2 [Scyliorhinus canicula]XP_038650833.1 kinetochore protein Nuf2 [Scyliorhinus canicula]
MEGDNRLPYPICKMDSIVNFCRRHILSGSEANNFTKADLSKPDSVQRLYMRCLQIIFDARPDCLYMMPMSENMPYPQLSEGFIPIMNLNVCMQNLILLCSIPYFEMSDLLNPKTKCTIVILSGIINFLQFRKGALDTYLNQQKSFKLNLEMMQQMVSSNEEMNYKIESLTTIPPEQKAKIDLLSADISELQQVLNHEYRLKQNSIQDATTQLKAEIAERNKMLGQIKLDMANAKEIQAHLKPLIVECPEQLNTEIQTMRETVEKKKEAMQKKNDRTMELQDKLASFTTFQNKELETYCSLLQQSQAGSDFICNMNTEIWNEENEQERKQMELRNLQTEETRLKRILGSKFEKHDKLQMQRQKKQETRAHDLDSVATEFDQFKQRSQEVSEQIAQINSGRQQYLAKSQALQESCAKDESECQNLYSKLLAHLEQYHERLAIVTQKATYEGHKQMAEIERAINERI